MPVDPVARFTLRDLGFVFDEELLEQRRQCRARTPIHAVLSRQNASSCNADGRHRPHLMQLHYNRVHATGVAAAARDHRFGSTALELLHVAAFVAAETKGGRGMVNSQVHARGGTTHTLGMGVRLTLSQAACIANCRAASGWHLRSREYAAMRNCRTTVRISKMQRGALGFLQNTPAYVRLIVTAG